MSLVAEDDQINAGYDECLMIVVGKRERLEEREGKEVGQTLRS